MQNGIAALNRFSDRVEHVPERDVHALRFTNRIAHDVEALHPRHLHAAHDHWEHEAKLDLRIISIGKRLYPIGDDPGIGASKG